MSARLPLSFDRRAAFLASLLMLALGFGIGVLNESAIGAQKLRELDIAARTLAQTVAAPLMFADPGAARENANAFAENPEVDAVGVYDQSGAMVASFVRNGSAPLPQHPAMLAARYRGASVEVVRPVERSGQHYGVVYVRLARESMISQLARYAPIALLVLMAALVLALGGAAQSALQQAYEELARRADDLAGANERLAREIENRKHAEEELVQSRKMEAIGQLTGGVAHDFNNLLMVVSGGVRMLRRNATDPERREKTMAALDQAVERGAGLTRQLLAFARRQPIKLESVDLVRCLNGMRELLERSLRGDILLDINIPDGLPPVSTDAGQLELAVLNLCVNARDAMPKGGVITVSASPNQAASSVDLIIRDTGAGIDPAILGRIFEPYFTTKAAGQGTGLGLAQVYGFARQCGGEVRIESELGVGTSVVLSLPIAATAVLEEAPRKTEPSKSESRRVLLVEDDDEVAATVSAMLEELGHRFTRAASVDEALRLLGVDRGYDLVFSDIIMPGGKSGIELARDLQRSMPELPVLLTTGYSGREDLDSRLPVLRKPYQISDLQAAMDAVMQSSDAEPAVSASLSPQQLDAQSR